MLRSCAECGTAAPDVPPGHAPTVLSVKYGWRLSRRTVEPGVEELTVRCPECAARSSVHARAAGDEAGRPSILAPPPGGKLVHGFRYGATLAGAGRATKIRSTWLVHSQGRLKRHGLYGQYQRLIAADAREALKALAPGGWSPMDVAVAHYRACEGLDLQSEEIVLLSAETGVEIQESMGEMPIRRETTDGSPPVWTALELSHGVLQRFTDGGGAAVYKESATEAYIEIGRIELAAIRYFRVALRGVLQGMVGQLARDVVVSEIDMLCTHETLGYHLVWGGARELPPPAPPLQR